MILRPILRAHALCQLPTGEPFGEQAVYVTLEAYRRTLEEIRRKLTDDLDARPTIGQIDVLLDAVRGGGPRGQSSGLISSDLSRYMVVLAELLHLIAGGKTRSGGAKS